MGATFALVRCLPRKAVSRALGILSELPLPPLVLKPVLLAYAKGFGVDLAEAGRPLGAYASFNDFFTRELRGGLRPIDPDPASVVSPVDARVYASGTVEAGRVLRVKGVPYDLAELLGSAADAAPFVGGTYLTAYLSPKDYHRIHWPFDGRVLRARHLPGDLWPVNDGAVAGVPRLFARNERIPIVGETETGRAFALVPVGALNVGSIRLAFHRIRTNRGGTCVPRPIALDAPVTVARGAEAARFAFGSAIVLLLAPGPGGLAALPVDSILRLGTRIGALA